VTGTRFPHSPLVPLPERIVSAEGNPQGANRCQGSAYLLRAGEPGRVAFLHACSQTGLYTAQCTIGGTGEALLHKAEDCEVRPELLF
jgi:hypothetical protein